MARRLHSYGLEILEQNSGVEKPVFDKSEKLEITSEQLKKDLNDLESKIPGARKILYDTQILSIRNDLDHLMEKTKGLNKTHEKTQDAGRGLFWKRQERMKRRTDVNEVTLAAINAKFEQLDDKIFMTEGIKSERQARKQLSRTLGINTDAIVKSGAVVVDANGKVIFDESKIVGMDPVLKKNIMAGRAVWEGDVNSKNVINSGAQGIIGGGLDKLWYTDKNINTVVNIAKLLAGFLILKTYWEKTDGFGEKLFWWVALYGLLSEDALGGWDMFWKGGKNGVLDMNGIINKVNGKDSVAHPEVIQHKEMIVNGKDKVIGLKSLFTDQQKLKEYLKNDGGKWSFDNQKFISNYGFDNLKGTDNPVAKEGYSLNDLNDPAAKCIILSLVRAYQLGKNADLNQQLDSYLQASDFKTPEEVINASSNDLNAKASNALAKIDKEQAALIAQKQAEEIKERSALNVWVLEVAGPGFVVVEWQEDAARAVKDLDLNNFEKKTLLDKQGIIRRANKQDVAEVTSQDREILEGLKNLGYTEQNANALVSALVDVRTTLIGSPAQYPKLVFEGKSVFYQNHGKKIEIKSKSPDETMKFDLSSLGLAENLAQGTAGFTAGLLLADALCNIFGYLGTMDKSKIVEKNGTNNTSSNEYPFRWDELTNSVKIASQSDLTSFDNTNTQISTVLRKAFEIGTPGIMGSKKDHTKIQNLLTNLNGAKITDEKGNKYNAWIEGQGFTIPAALNAQWASIEQKSQLNVESENIQTMGDLVMYVHDKTKEGAKVLWSDVVDVVERIGGDSADLIKKAIPVFSEINGLIYDEITKGIKVVYLDAKGAINTLYTDGKEAVKLIYNDGRSFTVNRLGPDARLLGTWTINTAGGWTKDAIKQLYSVMDELLSNGNIEKLKNYIAGVGGILGKTLEEGGKILKDGVAGLIEGTNSLIRDRDTWGLLLTILGYRTLNGVITWIIS
jgi:hypothetical protein